MSDSRPATSPGQGSVRMEISLVDGWRPAADRSSYKLLRATGRLMNRRITIVPIPRRRTSRPWSTSTLIACRIVGRLTPNRSDSSTSFSRRLPAGITLLSMLACNCLAIWKYSGTALDRSSAGVPFGHLPIVGARGMGQA